MKRLYVMQGVPGSGKSTVADLICRSSIPESADPWRPPAIILSTDDHRYGNCGHYFYDPAENVEFHSQTQRDCADAMRHGLTTIIIDNTNIEKWQAYPYIALAGMYGYEVNVVRVDPGLKEAKKRNAQRPIERRVPDHVVEAMYAKMENLL